MEAKYRDEGHTYFVEVNGKEIILPSVTQLMRTTGVIPQSDFEIPEKYAVLGTEVHAMTELVDKGMFYPEFCSEEALLYVLQYQSFLEENDVEILEIEQIIFNEELLYAGRLDRVMSINGIEYIVDIKTGGKYRWHARQLTAYKQAKGNYRIADLYLGKWEYKLVIQKPVQGIVEAMSACYWDAHPQAYKQLRKEQGR